jgi:hypothetical protein
LRKELRRFKGWAKPAAYSLIEAAAVDLIRNKPELLAEHAFLRQQLIVLERQVKHPIFTPVAKIGIDMDQL